MLTHLTGPGQQHHRQARPAIVAQGRIKGLATHMPWQQPSRHPTHDLHQTSLQACPASACSPKCLHTWPHTMSCLVTPRTRANQQASRMAHHPLFLLSLPAPRHVSFFFSSGPYSTSLQSFDSQAPGTCHTCAKDTLPTCN